MTVTLNAEMRVGGVQETITVTGETPVVDVQNSTRVQRVLDDAVVAALPASRGYGNLLATVSGIQANGIANSGIAPDMIFFTSRGGRSNEGTVQIDGMNVGSAFNGGGVAGYGYDTSGAQEVQVTVAGGLGEADRGGPAFNLVPKTGGNNFSGTYFGNIAGKWSQGDNVDDELRAIRHPERRGDHPQLGHELLDGRPDQARQGVVLRHGADVRRPTPTSPAASPTPTPATRSGGTTWSIRASRSARPPAGRSAAAASPSQLTPRNKVSAYYRLPEGVRGRLVREGRRASAASAATTGSRWAASATGRRSRRTRATTPRSIMQFSYTAPVTNKLLIDAAFSQFFSNWGGQTPAGALDQAPFIPVVQQIIGHHHAGRLLDEHPGGRTCRTTASPA